MKAYLSESGNKIVEVDKALLESAANRWRPPLAVVESFVQMTSLMGGQVRAELERETIAAAVTAYLMASLDEPG